MIKMKRASNVFVALAGQLVTAPLRVTTTRQFGTELSASINNQGGRQ